MVGLIAMVLVADYVRVRRTRIPTKKDWCVWAAGYAAACLFKEQGYVIVLMLVVADWLLLSSVPRLRSREYGIGFGLLAISAALTLVLRRSVLGEFTGSFVAPALEGDTWQRATTMLTVVPHWFRLLLWPVHLQIDYSPQEISAAHGIQVRGAIGLALVLGFVAACWRYRKHPKVAFGLVVCAIAILPVSNVLVPTGIVLAERTLFLPSVGFVLALCAGAEALIESRSAPGIERALGLLVAALAIVGIGRTAVRLTDWRDEWLLSVRSARQAPNSYKVQQAYANTLYEISQPQMGTAAYRRALELAPASVRWQVHNNFAASLRAVGATEAEVEQLAASLRIRPDQAEPRGHLIAAYLLLGRYEDAIRAADDALKRGSFRFFEDMKALADSALRVQAPPGSIKIGVTAGRSRAIGPQRSRPAG